MQHKLLSVKPHGSINLTRHWVYREHPQRCGVTGRATERSGTHLDNVIGDVTSQACVIVHCYQAHNRHWHWCLLKCEQERSRIIHKAGIKVVWWGDGHVNAHTLAEDLEVLYLYTNHSWWVNSDVCGTVVVPNCRYGFQNAIPIGPYSSEGHVIKDLPICSEDGPNGCGLLG